MSRPAGRAGHCPGLRRGPLPGRVLRPPVRRGVHCSPGHFPGRLSRQGHGRSRGGPSLRHDRRAGTGPREAPGGVPAGRRRRRGGDRQLQLPRPAGHRWRAGRRGPGRRTGQGAGRQALPAPEGQRALPHLPPRPPPATPCGRSSRRPPSARCASPCSSTAWAGRWGRRTPSPPCWRSRCRPPSTWRTPSPPGRAGVDTIVEIGPGKALSGFVKKTAPAIKTYAVETCADLDALSQALKG